MRTEGIITSWNDEKGFGFIKEKTGSQQTFVHLKSFANRSRRPQKNMAVAFTVSTDNLGRRRAVNVVLAGDKAVLAKSSRPKSKTSAVSLLLAVCVFIVVGVSVYSFVSNIPY